MNLDMIIKDGCVIDGTGNPSFKADVGIRDGKIAKIGNLSLHSAEEKIDAKGLVVTPGVIDIHTHSDFTLLVNPTAESSIRQGITTSVIGNCGHSCAPVTKAAKDLLKKSIFGYLPVTEIDWYSFDEYLNRLENQGVAQNVAALVGHGAVRIAVIGFENKAPNNEELKEMKKLVAEAMKDGAFGISSGLAYAPGSYANTKELIELCKVAANYGGFYATHVRTYGEPGRLEAVKEAVMVGEAAGIPVEISHHAASANAEETLAIIDEARAKGVDVTCDLHPYLWAATTITSIFPKKALEGGVERLLERLRDPKERKEIAKNIDLKSVHTNLDWDKVVLERSEKSSEFVGKSFTEIEGLMKVEPPYVAINLLLKEYENPYNVYVRLQSYAEKDVIAVLKSPFSMIGSDGIALAPYGPLATLRYHPRSYGAFPRVLRLLVKERGIITLQDAIRKMTSLPAQRLQIRDRGLLREGMWADIVIFDPEKIRDKATYEEPNLYPEGIKNVIVNGTVVIENGSHTGALPGKVLRKI